MKPEPANQLNRRAFCRTLALPAGALILGGAQRAWAKNGKDRLPDAAPHNAAQPKFSCKVLWEFDAMDVWATYKIESEAGRFRLVRDGDVQIYPPDFVPGGGKKLSVQQTSLRGILQKRFNKVFDEVIEIEPLDLPGELAAAGPLPLEQLVARKDGWVAAGWRQADRVVHESVVTDAIPGEVIIEERIISAGPGTSGEVFGGLATVQEGAGRESLVLAAP